MDIDITDTYKVDYHGFVHSHMDALCHFPYKGMDYNGHPAAVVNTRQGCTQLGIEKLKNGIVTRGVLVDIPRLKHVDYLELATPIYVEDLEAWERSSGVKISPGDALFVRTGRWALWAKKGPWSMPERGMAGLHASVIPWLKARGVAYLGSDGGSDVYPSQVTDVLFPIHMSAISGLGVALFDNLDLEAAAARAAVLNRWEFLFVVAPLPVPAGTGSPVNPLAIY
jgi:kynurenine formamidase